MVNIENSAGEIKPVMKNIRFQSGDALSTGYDGLASVGLDETKIVTLEPNSRVEFTKSAKQLQLNLTEGGMFLEVTEKLKDVEIFDITTSNMTVGIRGTSCYISANEKMKSTLVQLTSGHIAVRVKDPLTSNDKEVSLTAGQQVLIVAKTVNGEIKNEVVVSRFGAKDLPVFVAKAILQSPKTLTDVILGSGITQDDLENRANGAPADDEPSPSVTTTPTPSAAPEDDGNGTTPTATATATPTITPPLTTTPTLTTTPKPTVTSKPTATSKPTDTLTTTPTPDASSSPTNTVSTTPTDTVSTTPTNDPIAEPTTTEPTGSATPTVPDNCASVFWGVEDPDFGTVYIVVNRNGGFLGWVDNKWVSLTYEEANDGGLYQSFYAGDDLYYEVFTESQTGETVGSQG